MQDRDIIIKLKAIDKEIARRQRDNKLELYNKDMVHHKQIEFHKCDKSNRWVFGGNRSGKTECGAVETVWLARGIHPYKDNKPGIECWVVSLSTQVQRDVAQKKILSYLKKDWIVDVIMTSGKRSSLDMGVIDTIVIRNVFGGVSRIGFKSCDQGREKFQGTSLDFVWFDEEPPEDIYMECKMRVLDKCGEIFGTMTPLKGLTWVYNTIYLNCNNDPDVWYITMEWADNPYLNKSEIDKLTSVMSADELDSRRYGRFSQGSGLVYSEFDERVNVIEPFDVPKEWFDKISIDPGLHNPLSCHWYACDYDGNVYVIAEHYAKEQSVEYHASKIKEISSNLGWKKGFNGMYEAIIDSAANQKTLSSNKSVVDLFYENGILLNASVNKNVFSGINRVKSYIKNVRGERRLFIFKNCVNMIREIKSYYWGDNDSPVKKDDHAMDELRYYIMSMPENKPPKPKKSAIQLDKEKKIKYLQRSYSNYQ